MISGQTRHGFRFEVDESRIANDMELLDLLVDSSDGNPLAAPRLLRRILPEETRRALYEYLRGEDGIVPADKVGEAMMDIIGAFEGGKK